VVVDTDVFSKVVLPGRIRSKRDPNRQAWLDALLGYRIVMAVQTRVELLAWPIEKNWGAPRRAELEEFLATSPVLQITEDVQDRYATLTAALKALGHGLGAKHHTGDRWVAATALAHDLPIAAMDGIYDNVPGLTRILP
jgi:predicted nucleic acid-binding protein